MDVLTATQRRLTPVPSRVNLITGCGFVVYCFVVIAGAIHHESWADEAQSWLLARDATLQDLWTRLLHYEGTPGLWQTLLHALIRLGLPYEGLKVFSGLLGAAAAALWMWCAPIPLVFRIAAPFTFFLSYQYVVIARSYSLLPPLLFVGAMLCRNALKHRWRLALVLSLMAAVSVHGMMLSLAIWVSSLASREERLNHWFKKMAWPGLAYVSIVGVCATAAWPVRDAAFVTRWNLSPEHFGSISLTMLREAFTGNWFWSAAVVLLSVPFLWRGGGIIMFAASTTLLCSVGSIIYSQVWHQGVILLAWLFAIWISASRTKMDVASKAAMGIVIIFQAYWTARSIVYDWGQPYSGGSSTAEYLRVQRIPEHGLFAIGYACTGIQPYFGANIFANERGGAKPAYWDWSLSNRMNQDSGLLAVKRPEYVIVGYKGVFEQALWTNAVLSAGYQRVRHFEGNLYWRTSLLEPESFDLYRRSASVGNTPSQ